MNTLAAGVGRGRRTSLLAVLWLLAMVVLAGPASAHTDLIAATPTADSSGAAPRVIQLDFTDAVMSRLTEVIVRDASGGNRVEGPIGVFGNRVQAALSDLEPGHYDVAYRVVAADGHPIVGDYSFDVEGTAGSTTGDGSATGVGSTATAGATAPAGGDSPLLAPLVAAISIMLVVALRLHHRTREITS